jgi:hypothetical protein
MWREGSGVPCKLRDLPQIDERIGLLVAQEVINVDYQRLRRVDVHVVAVLWALQVRIWVYERLRPDVWFGFDDIFLLSGSERAAETRSTEENVNYGNDCCEFKDCPPSKRWWHDDVGLLLVGSLRITRKRIWRLGGGKRSPEAKGFLGSSRQARSEQQILHVHCCE